MNATANGAGTCIYLHLSDSSPVQEEEINLADGKTAKVLWKDVLVEGEYPMSPGPNGATSDPMRVIAEGESDAATKTISMSDLIASHEDGAFKYVTIPTTHKDGVLDNTGYVPRPKGVRIVEKSGKKVFQAALGFTEPDVKGKVQRGTIPDVSAGIFFNWVNKHSKKMYRAAMKHVALTPTPFMGNLDPFPAVFASDDELSRDMSVEWYSLADGDDGTSVDSSSGTKGEIIWNEAEGLNWTRGQIEAALRPDRPTDDDRPYQPMPEYYVEDVSPSSALVTEWFKGDRTRWVIPYSRSDEGVEVAPATRWTEGKEAMIAASDNTADFDALTPEKVLEALNVKLSEDFKTQGFELSVEKVTLDNRALIKNVKTGSEYVASFFMSDGGVRVAPSDQWEAVKAPVPKDTAPRPAMSAPVIKLSDTPSDDAESRLAVARQRRRHLVA